MNTEDRDLQNILNNVDGNVSNAIKAAYEAGKRAGSKKPVTNSTFVISNPAKPGI